MRLLFVADGRSPIALNWISHFVETGHEVHLVSTFPCQPALAVTSLEVIPVAFAAAAGGGTPSSSGLRRLVPVGLRTAVRQRLGPLTLPSAARRLAEIIAPPPAGAGARPAHPLRGHAGGAGAELKRPPLPWSSPCGATISPCTPPPARTCAATPARLWGAPMPSSPIAAAICAWQPNGASTPPNPPPSCPAGAACSSTSFYPPQIESQLPVVINPRGFRAYVQNEAFFHAIPLVLAAHPEARFVCPAMAGEAQAQRWVDAAGHRRQRRPAAAPDPLRRWRISSAAPGLRSRPPPTTARPTPCSKPWRAAVSPWLATWSRCASGSPPARTACWSIPAIRKPWRRRSSPPWMTPPCASTPARPTLALIAARADYRQVMASAEMFYQDLVTRPHPPPT